MSTQTQNETRHTEFRPEAAAIGEQFRKATQTTAEQTRQTMTAMQERLQENLSRAQQAQSEWARMMFRLSEQNTQLATSALSSLWDANLSAMKFFTWGEDQAERNMIRNLEQHRHTREEGMQLLNETADITRHNQAEVYRLTQESLRTSLFFAVKAGRKEGEPVK